MVVPDHIKKKRLQEDKKVKGDDFFSIPMISYILFFIFIILCLYAIVGIY